MRRLEPLVGTEERVLQPFTDADLRLTLRRAMRTVAVLTVVLFLLLWFRSGWRMAMLLLTGGLVSLASLFEWQRLVAVLTARMDNQQSPHSTGLVLTMFFVRLLIAGGVLYGSLKCFAGSGYGSILVLAAGLCLAILSLSIEALKMLIL